jgi:TolA-binding protein
MGEEGYMNKNFCLECSSKHANRLEHHFEDMVTATHNEPELRQQAQEMLDQIRQMRKKIDEVRINELAKKKLKEGGI